MGIEFCIRYTLIDFGAKPCCLVKVDRDKKSRVFVKFVRRVGSEGGVRLLSAEKNAWYY